MQDSSGIYPLDWCSLTEGGGANTGLDWTGLDRAKCREERVFDYKKGMEYIYTATGAAAAARIFSVRMHARTLQTAREARRLPFPSKDGKLHRLR